MIEIFEKFYEEKACEQSKENLYTRNKEDNKSIIYESLIKTQELVNKENLNEIFFKIENKNKPIMNSYEKIKEFLQLTIKWLICNLKFSN